jgi:hypothetical protein
LWPLGPIECFMASSWLSTSLRTIIGVSLAVLCW